MMHISAHVHVSAIRANARNAHTYLRYVHMCSTSAEHGHGAESGLDQEMPQSHGQQSPEMPLQCPHDASARQIFRTN